MKYHEHLDGTERITPPSDYHHKAEQSVWHAKDPANELGRSPFVQIWRDHLLAGSMLLNRSKGFSEGFYAMLD